MMSLTKKLLNILANQGGWPRIELFNRITPTEIQYGGINITISRREHKRFNIRAIWLGEKRGGREYWTGGCSHTPFTAHGNKEEAAMIIGMIIGAFGGIVEYNAHMVRLEFGIPIPHSNAEFREYSFDKITNALNQICACEAKYVIQVHPDEIIIQTRTEISMARVPEWKNIPIGTVVNLFALISHIRYTDFIRLQRGISQRKLNPYLLEYVRGIDFDGRASVAIPIAAPNPTPNPTPSEMPIATPSEMPIATPSEMPIATPNPTPSETPIATPNPTPSEMPSEMPNPTPNPTPSEMPIATFGPTPIAPQNDLLTLPDHKIIHTIVKKCTNLDEITTMAEAMLKEEYALRLEHIRQVSLKLIELNVNECVICQDAAANCVLIPCGHKCVCVNCSANMRDCPLCRSDLSKSVKVYW